MVRDLSMKEESIKEGDSGYCWVNIEIGGTRVGKARIKKIYSRLVIKNITVFPEFEGHGIAKQAIDLFKESAREIIADRVRGSARGFWERMGFSDTRDGNYRWVSSNS